MVWFQRYEDNSPGDFDDEIDFCDTLRLGPLLLHKDEATQHFLAAAATGGGKTTILRLLMQDVIPYIESGTDTRALVYDAKQDVFSTLNGMAKGVRIVTTNPFDDRGVAWDLARDVCEPRVAVEITFTLMPHRQESQPFFSDAARHLTYGAMVSFMWRKLNWGLADLIRALSSGRRLRRILQACPYTRDLIPRYFRDRRLLASILSTIATKMLPYEPIAAAWETAKSKISLEDWVKSEFVLVLGNSETSRHAIDAINRCMFKRGSDLLLNQSESATRRSWFFIDEVSEAGRLDGLVSLLKKGRSKGGCVAIAFQSIAGLRDSQMYGPHLTAEILGQIGHRFIGRLECPETAEWASQLFGDQEIRQITENVSFGKERVTSKNEQIVTRKAVLSSEFMSLAPCDDLNGLTGYYLSRVVGAFSATLPGDELFHQDIIPRDTNTADFVPRAVDAQFLKPWSKQTAEEFAPPMKVRRRAENAQQQDAKLDVLDELDNL